jgi:MFS transporter, DHA3 family, macrolide efflux protein
MESNFSFRRFLVVWAGQLLSRIGSGLSAFALGVVVLEQSGSTTLYSALLLAAFLPSVLLSPLGGVMADRFDRKLLMAIGDLGAALGVGFIVLMRWSGSEAMWPFYVGVSFSSVFVAVHGPAFKASISDLLSEKDYARASGLVQLAEASRFLLAPFMAAFLLSWFNIQTVLLLDVLTFALAALAVLAIRRSGKVLEYKPDVGSVISELLSGLRYVMERRFLVRLLLLTTCVTFFTGVLQAMLAPMVLGFADAQTLGVVQSVAASGMLVSSAFIGILSKSRNQRATLAYGLLGCGIFFAFMGLRPGAVWIAATGFGLFVTLPFVNTSLEVLFRSHIENKMQGRAWALIGFISQLGLLLALAVAGPLADAVFNPLMVEGGALAGSVGKVLGTGAMRGGALMVVMCGMGLAMLAVGVLPRKRAATTPEALIAEEIECGV